METHITQPDTCAVIVAGGLGVRFGLTEGKQFVDICGLPMVGWSIKAFLESPSIGVIVLVCPADKQVDVEREILTKLQVTKPIIFAESADTRQQSVFSGLKKVPRQYEYVAIHDGARPLIQPQTIENSISPLREDPTLDGAVCGQPCVDTLKIVSGTMVTNTPNRSYYWAVQTPQTFRRSLIFAIHEWAQETELSGTDDASLVEKYGKTVRLIESPRDNTKVTLPEDLVPVRAILKERLEQAGESVC